jgi:hypothetical protein
MIARIRNDRPNGYTQARFAGADLDRAADSVTSAMTQVKNDSNKGKSRYTENESLPVSAEHLVVGSPGPPDEHEIFQQRRRSGNIGR